MTRVCAYRRCSEPVVGRRPQAKYHSDQCKRAEHRARKGTEPEARLALRLWDGYARHVRRRPLVRA